MTRLADCVSGVEQKERDILEGEMVRNLQDLMGKNKKELTDKISKVFKQVTVELERKRVEMISELDSVFDSLLKKTGKELDFPKFIRTNLNIWKSEYNPLNQC